jgi:hypothetical protein
MKEVGWRCLNWDYRNLRGKKRDVGEGTCPLYDEHENVIHILLNFSETQSRRE